MREKRSWIADEIVYDSKRERKMKEYAKRKKELEERRKKERKKNENRD